MLSLSHATKDSDKICLGQNINLMNTEINM